MKDRPQKRFYIAKSQIYGLTVYDRISQTPAFSYGAEQNMREFSALELANKLNSSLYRVIHTQQKLYPDMGEFNICIAVDEVLVCASNKYRLSIEDIEEILKRRVCEIELEVVQ